MNKQKNSIAKIATAVFFLRGKQITKLIVRVKYNHCLKHWTRTTEMVGSVFKTPCFCRGPGLLLSTYMLAQNHLSLQFQEIC